MNIHVEALLRSLGLFLAVYFTVDWGKKSSPGYDVSLMLVSIVFALVLKYYE
jgi:hypothetical protein